MSANQVQNKMIHKNLQKAEKTVSTALSRKECVINSVGVGLNHRNVKGQRISDIFPHISF